MKRLAEGRDKQADTLDWGLSGIVAVLGLIAIISKWMCLLAIVDTGDQMSATSTARWIYAGFLCLSILASFCVPLWMRWGGYTFPKTPLYFLWLFLATASSTVALVALFAGRMDVALLIEFGWRAFDAVRKCIVPDNASGTPFEKEHLINAGFRLVFLALVLASLQFRSVPLAVLLFVFMLLHMAVSVIPIINRVKRAKSEQK